MSKKKITFNKRNGVGMGFMPWKKFQERLREIDVLGDDDQLKSVEITDAGFHFTTNKIRKSSK